LLEGCNLLVILGEAESYDTNLTWIMLYLEEEHKWALATALEVEVGYVNCILRHRIGQFSTLHLVEGKMLWNVMAVGAVLAHIKLRFFDGRDREPYLVSLTPWHHSRTLACNFPALNLDHVASLVEELSKLDHSTVLEASILAEERLVSFVEVLSCDFRRVSTFDPYQSRFRSQSFWHFEVEGHQGGLSDIKLYCSTLE
jgi:hypothetical protein